MRLETEHTHRSVVPSDPALAFIDMIIEDFGNEWVTKMMAATVVAWSESSSHEARRVDELIALAEAVDGGPTSGAARRGNPSYSSNNAPTNMGKRRATTLQTVS